MITSTLKTPGKLERMVVFVANMMLKKLLQKQKDGVRGWDRPGWFRNNSAPNSLFKNNWIGFYFRHEKDLWENGFTTNDIVDVLNILGFKLWDNEEYPF